MDTVTAPHFAVSCTTGSGIVGAILNVRRTYPALGPYALGARADLDGTQWPNSTAAFEAARERGYLQAYTRRRWCPHCRTLHGFIGKPSPYSATFDRDRSHCADQWAPFARVESGRIVRSENPGRRLGIA